MTTLLQHNRRASAESVPEAIVNDAPRTFADADFPVGTAAHQGDLIFVRIDELPASAKPTIERQLADGATQGSRHVLETGSVFRCDARQVAAVIERLFHGVRVSERYIGPVFQTIGGKAHVSHPEHGDHHYEGDMTMATIYQRSLDSEEREQRVQD